LTLTLSGKKRTEPPSHLRRFFKDNMTGGDIRLKNTVERLKGALSGPDSPPVTVQLYNMYIPLNIELFNVTSLTSGTFVQFFLARHGFTAECN